MRFGTFSYNQARPRVPERQAFEELLEQIQLTEMARPDSLVGLFSFGGLSHAHMTRSIELFATRVMPFLGSEAL